MFCSWSSCCWTVKHKLAGHAIDPDTFLHEDVLCYDHHAAAQWNANSLTTRLIQIRSFMKELWFSCCGTRSHPRPSHSHRTRPWTTSMIELSFQKTFKDVDIHIHKIISPIQNEQLFARLGWSARHSRHGNLMSAPKCVSCESCPRTIWKKHQKRVARTGRPTPTAKPRAQRPHWSPEGRAATQTNARTITEPQGPSTSISTHTHTHTETKNQQARNRKGARTHPKKKTMTSRRGKRPTRGVAEDSQNLACHVPSRTESGQPQVVADDLGALDAVRVVALRDYRTDFSGTTMTAKI